MKKRQDKKGPIRMQAPKQDTLPKTEYSRGFSDLLALAIIILLGIVIYSNSFNCSFHYDDMNNIVENKTIANASDWLSWWNFSHNRLVAFISFAFNYHFGQYNVWGYHLVNLIIHLINACLVWWLTLLIFSSPALKDSKISEHKKILALLTALLFVSHPLATQSVTYIVQRMASMVAMFYLLSIVLYLKARLTENGNSLKILLFAGSILSAVFAMFTKENAFTLPFAILLVEFFFIRTKKINIDFKDYRTILVIAGFIGFIIFVSLKFSFSIFKPLPPTPFHSYSISSFDYFLTQFSVIVKYIQLLVLPLNQMVDYDVPLSTNFFEVRTMIGFLVILSLIIMALYVFNKNRIISFGIFWFLLTLSIESSFIPIYDVIFDHRTYLPSFGFFLIISSGVFVLLYDKYKFLTLGIFAILIVSNSYLTFERNKVWKDDFSLWNDNVKKAPNLIRPLINRAVAYQSTQQWDKALADYSKAITMNPNYAEAFYNRGQVNGNLKQWNKAIVDYSKAIELDPNYAFAYNNRGAAYVVIQQWEKAIADYSKAIEIEPKNAIAYNNRGLAFGNLNDWNKAIADYTKAIAINPNFSEAYYDRGIAFKSLSDWDKAIADYSTAISMNPSFADAYCNRGIIYATQKLTGKAIDDYGRAININPNHAKAHFNRGAAYSTIGQWENVIADYDAAISINPNYTLAYNNRGIAYASMKQWDKAVEDYNRALKIDPNFSLAQSNLEIAKKNLK